MTFDISIPKIIFTPHLPLAHRLLVFYTNIYDVRSNAKKKNTMPFRFLPLSRACKLKEKQTCRAVGTHYTICLHKTNPTEWVVFLWVSKPENVLYCVNYIVSELCCVAETDNMFPIYLMIYRVGANLELDDSIGIWKEKICVCPLTFLTGAECTYRSGPFVLIIYAQKDHTFQMCEHVTTITPLPPI